MIVPVQAIGGEGFRRASLGRIFSPGLGELVTNRCDDGEQGIQSLETSMINCNGGSR